MRIDQQAHQTNEWMSGLGQRWLPESTASEGERKHSAMEGGSGEVSGVILGAHKEFGWESGRRRRPLLVSNHYMLVCL